MKQEGIDMQKSLDGDQPTTLIKEDGTRQDFLGRVLGHLLLTDVVTIDFKAEETLEYRPSQGLGGVYTVLRADVFPERPGRNAHCQIQVRRERSLP
jgi:hypothetical protein